MEINERVEIITYLHNTYIIMYVRRENSMKCYHTNPEQQREKHVETPQILLTF